MWHYPKYPSTVFFFVSSSGQHPGAASLEPGLWMSTSKRAHKGSQGKEWIVMAKTLAPKDVCSSDKCFNYSRKIWKSTIVSLSYNEITLANNKMV
jgi:hypothetical protein